MKNKLFYMLILMATLILFTISAAPCAEQAAADENKTNTPERITASGLVSPDSSVLERFRTYSGPRTPEGLSALFTSGTPQKVRQQPLVALSDGSTALMVAVKVTISDELAPSFTFDGARFVSLQRIQNDEWLLKAIPDKGVVSASMLIRTTALTFEYPLAVAPPAPAATDLSEQGFITFLAADRSAATSSKLDLNQDGRTNYIDDYIFTANYLAKHLATGSDREARRQRAMKRTLSAPNSIPPQSAPAKDYDGVIYGDI